MQITRDNYFEAVKKFGFKKLPDVLKSVFTVISVKTGNGKDWTEYERDDEFKRLVDLNFAKLEEFLSLEGKQKHVVKSLDGAFMTPLDVAIGLIRPYVISGDLETLRRADDLSFDDSEHAAHVEGGKIIVTMLYGTKISESFDLAELIEQVNEESKSAKSRSGRRTLQHKQPEFRFIKAYMNWHKATVSTKMVAHFLSQIEDAIQDGSLDKTSQVYDTILLIHGHLEYLFATMGNTTKYEIPDQMMELCKRSLKLVTDKNKLPPKKNKGPEEYGGEGLSGTKQATSYKFESRFIKSFLALDGHAVSRKEVGELIDKMKEAIGSGKLNRSTPLREELNLVQTEMVKWYNRTKGSRGTFVIKAEKKQHLKSILKRFTETRPPAIATRGERRTGLNGPGQVVDSHSASGPTIPSRPELINSRDLLNINFPTIGFKGKWKDFIGDPSPGFRAAVSGKPKMGKTNLCLDFADYLSNNHGKVLYVSKEEYLSPTLNLKLKEKNVGNENLDFAGAIPNDLTAYQYVFLDSVSSLKLTTDDLKKLEASNPGKSFIYVFQVTKEGKARGTNEFMHNVDIIIEVPEKGKAIQYGRYNQGGEMKIFSVQSERMQKQDAEVQNGVLTLSGIGSSKTERNTDNEHAEQMEIKVQVNVPFELIQMSWPGEEELSDEAIRNLADEEPEKLQDWIRSICDGELEGTRVSLGAVIKTWTRQQTETYFTCEVLLKGSRADLKQLTEESECFIYDWCRSESGMKNTVLKELQSKRK